MVSLAGNTIWRLAAAALDGTAVLPPFLPATARPLLPPMPAGFLPATTSLSRRSFSCGERAAGKVN